jgi:alpha-N-arabinofuranosidase
LRNPYAEDWSLTQRPGWLRLNGSAITLDTLDSPAFLGRRQQHFDFNATTVLDFKPSKSNEEAGITALGSNQYHYEIAIRTEGNHRIVFVRFKLGYITNLAAKEEIPDGPVYLRISGKGLYYSFSYSLDNKNFKTIAKVNNRFLSAEVIGGFTGVVLGMYTTGNGQKSLTPADFDWFEYQPLSE